MRTFTPQSPIAKESPLLAMLPTVVLALALAWGISYITYSSSRELLPLPLLIQLAIIAAIAWYEQSVRSMGVLTPLMVALAAYAVMFAVVPFIDILQDHPLTHHAAWWTTEWLAVLGLLSLYLGYRLVVFLSHWQRPTSSRWTWSSNRATLAGVLFLGISASIALLLFGSIGGRAGYLAIFRERTLVLRTVVPLILGISLAIPAFLLMAGRWVHRPTIVRGLGVLLIWLPLTIILVGALGARFRIAVVAVALLAVYHLGYRRIGTIVLAALVALMSVTFIVFAIRRNFVGARQVSPEVNVSNLYDRYLSTHDSVGEFREFMTTVEAVPTKLPYQEGATLLSIVPTTEHPTGGQLYSSTFFGDLYATGTSISPSLPGELYMNFGLPGVAIGMVLFGCFVGLLETYYKRNRGRIGSLLIYAFSLFFVAMELRGDFTSMTTYYVAGLVPLVIALRFVERRESKAVLPTREGAGRILGTT